MKTIELINRLREKAVFRVTDIEKLELCNKNYAKLVLNRLIKRKLIKRVTKNIYTTQKNIFLTASNITTPSYISFWSASSFLGYTEQILNTVQIASTRRMKSIEFEGYKIDFIRLDDFFGYKKIKTDEGEIFIAEDEKLLIDSFLRYREMGNFDEIIKVFENAKIAKNKIVDYLKRINNKSVIKRVGYLLENIKNIDISDNFKLDNNYIFLNQFSKKWKKTSSKWRLKI